jgi:hypothetical protein
MRNPNAVAGNECSTDTGLPVRIDPCEKPVARPDILGVCAKCSVAYKVSGCRNR